VLSRSGAEVRLRPLGGRQTFFEVIRAAFNLIRVDRARLEHQFGMIARLAAEVPVRRLSYARRFSTLNAVVEAVLRDQARLNQQAVRSSSRPPG
jgi:hypothetical protein